MRIRKFKTGASRDSDKGKVDFDGSLSPLVLERFAQYMMKHTKVGNEIRPADNWKKGIPLDAYMKSGFRHFFDWWKEHHHLQSREGLEDALCGVMFNVMGYLHEKLNEKK